MSKNYGVRGSVNDKQAKELQLHIENTQSFYPQVEYLQKYKNKRVAKKTYDPNKMVKAAYNVVNYALKDKTIGRNTGFGKHNVSPATRKAVAQALVNRLD